MPDVAVAVFQDANQTALGAILEQDVVTIGAGADNTAALQPDSTIALTVRLQPDTACWVAWGVGAVASATNGIRMAAGSTEYISIAGGDRISAIQL